MSTNKGCNFSCNTGFVKNTASFTCSFPDTGKYADSSGDEQSCNRPTGDSGGFDTFLANTRAVSSATGCGFSCNAGFVKDGADRECNYPTPGSYVNNQGTEASCNPITIQGTAVASWIAGSASAANSCPFSCTAGYVKNGRACKIPDKGKYADNGVEKACSPITGDSGGFDDFAVNLGAVTAADGCGFSCSAGSVKDSSDRECNYPTPGSYVNTSGAEVACTDITSTPNFNSWVSGAATDADSCPFSCSTGFTVSGRMCREYKPQMLA